VVSPVSMVQAGALAGSTFVENSLSRLAATDPKRTFANVWLRGGLSPSQRAKRTV
jgi:hypothetical protein